MSAPLQTSSAAGAQASQAGLALLLKQEVGKAFQTLDVHDFEATLDPFTQSLYALIFKYGQASAALSANYYRTARRDAGVPGRITIVPADPAPPVQVKTAVSWATQPLRQPEQDIAAFETQIQGLSSKMVMDAGRSTVIDAVHRDKKAKGWARIPEPSKSKSGTCAFCALLCTRGLVYKSRTSGDFRSHDHCECHAEPVFNAYEPSAQVREWRALYAASTRHVSGKAKRAEFRRALAARDAASAA